MHTRKILYKTLTIFIIISLLLPLGINYTVKAVTTLTLDDCPYDIEFEKIASDWYLSMGIDSNGYLWGWGSSNDEVFGEAGVRASTAPRKISETIRFKDVAVSSSHILAIDLDGNLYSWGNNSDGQVGDGTTQNVIFLKKIKSGTKFSQVSVSRSSSFAIDTNGNLWAWGSYTARLGLEDIREDVLEPQKVSETIKFSKISASDIHSLAISRDQKLYSWGNNLDGQLGNGGMGSSQRDVETPTQIMPNQTFKDIVTGTLYSMAIDTNGNIWAWGSNDNGQLGDGTTQSTGTPKQITTGKVFNKIEAGKGGRTKQGASFAIDNEGKLWSWGYNENWWLGNGGKENTLQPTKVMENINFKEISAGQYYAIGIDTNKDSWSWGSYLGAKGTGLSAPQNKAIRFTGEDYVVTFKDGTNTLKTEKVKFNKAATAPTPTKEGYVLSWDKEFTNVMEDLTITAVWSEIPNATYKVEHYKQNLETNTYDKVENDTENLTGAAGQIVTATAKNYEGYTENVQHESRVASGEIKTDGSLVLKLYYDINEYTVTFKDGETVLKTEKVKHGQAATAPTPTKQGYILTWSQSFNSVTSDLEVNAVWTPDTAISYKVEHYKQNPTTNTYEKVENDTENLTGTTGQIVTATAKTYEGYTENVQHESRVASGKIKADGSLLLKLYYDANTYKVTLNTNGGTIATGQELTSYTYGVGATLPTPTKTGYIFAGWYNNAEFTGETIANIGTKAVGDRVYFAKWTQNQLTVTFKDGNTILKTEKVAYGQAATAPTPIKDGYVLRWDKQFNNITIDLTVNAIWLVDTDKDGIPDIEDSETLVTYTVKHYKQIADTNEYRLEETESLKGQLGSTVTATAKTYEGYVENTTLAQRVASGIVTADGKLELKLFYDTVKQEEPKQVTYKVEHYAQTKNGYELKETEELTAKVGDEVVAAEKGYASHVVNKQVEGTIQTGTVTESGELVLKLYYDYKQFTVIFKDGDKVVKTQTVIYGEEAIAPILTKTGYILSWDKKTDNITQNETFTAVWTKDPNYVDPNDGKDEAPSKLPQTGESCMIAGTISVLISIAVFLYLKYRKIYSM